MKTNKATVNPVEILDAQIKNLNRQKEMLTKLIEEKTAVSGRLSQIEHEMEALIPENTNILEMPETKAEEAKQGGGGRDLPRGVLTKVVFDAVRPFNDNGASIKEINRLVKGNPLVKDCKDLEVRVRNLLNNSVYFKRLQRGIFKVNKAPEGALFERLYSTAA